MPPKQIDKNPPVVISSRHTTGTNQDVANDGALEETEIAAQISIPQDGGWAWVVLFASFFSIFIMDGVIFTFGSMLREISADLNAHDSLIALVNSVACALYFSLSPLASALINRFGFRACTMIGSVVCSIALFGSYISSSFAALLLFNGILYGLGCALINMSAGLVVGFYFEKFRAIALAISSCGTSAGITMAFPLDNILTDLVGWRTVMLLNSGLHGIIFFLGMTFKPLLSVTVTSTDVDPQQRTRTVTYLPSVSVAALRTPSSKTRATNTEKFFGSVSNTNFPTAAEVVGESMSGAAGTTATTTQAGPSTTPSSAAPLKLTLTTQGTVSLRHLKQVQSIVSRPNTQEKKRSVDMKIKAPPSQEKSCCGRLFHWEPHAPHARPMYRDDAFYGGKISDLPIYQKSVAEVKTEDKTGLEYQMAVSRAVTTSDLQEKRGIFTTAVRRVLATMMDLSILRKCSFQFYCCYGFCTYAGVMVPYVYLTERNELAGVSEEHCAYFVSVIAFASAIGRLSLSAVAMKLDPVQMSAWCAVVAGLSTVFSGMSTNVAFQYAYSLIYGISTSAVNCLRSLVLVKLYGLEKLTNATGMYFLFLGIGNIFSTPVAGLLKDSFGYDVAFFVAGGFLVLAGICIFALIVADRKEKARRAEDFGNKQRQKTSSKINSSGSTLEKADRRKKRASIPSTDKVERPIDSPKDNTPPRRDPSMSSVQGAPKTKPNPIEKY